MYIYIYMSILYIYRYIYIFALFLSLSLSLFLYVYIKNIINIRNILLDITFYPSLLSPSGVVLVHHGTCFKICPRHPHGRHDLPCPFCLSHFPLPSCPLPAVLASGYAALPSVPSRLGPTVPKGTMAPSGKS